ncbi:hypothetical protein AJ78_05750 [Emergomyces pasteurianus Ep9510]|uniref:Uncharacterized protein n=1 Tax=Emergomyces pasteurianus Ep9510 TaxID=1447872 RepID=A0A1J9Q0W8_9EURO|nr:hypothetical protein AJ78_05750 [Emergomyces pasteurianus Ep9510]
MLKLFHEPTLLLPLLLFLLLFTVNVPLTLAYSNDRLRLRYPSLRTKTGNPILDGWYADPELRIFEKHYYLYPTYSAAFDQQTFFEAFVSSDLVTWTPVGRILDFVDVPWSNYSAAWAPSVGYKNGLYYLYFAAGNGVGIGVAVASSPAGPFRDALGKPLVGEYLYGAQPIDAMVFMDGPGPNGGSGEGRHYLYWGGRGHAVVAELAEDMVSFTGEFIEVTPEKEYVEGPWMLKRNGVYYFMYSVGNWTDNSYGVKYVKGNSPMGPFTRPSKLILTGDPNVATSTGHNSVFNIGEDYYIVYHRRYWTDATRDHRVVCIDKMFFDEHGEINLVKITDEGVDGRNLSNSML